MFEIYGSAWEKHARKVQCDCIEELFLQRLTIGVDQFQRQCCFLEFNGQILSYGEPNSVIFLSHISFVANCSHSVVCDLWERDIFGLPLLGSWFFLSQFWPTFLLWDSL